MKGCSTSPAAAERRLLNTLLAAAEQLKLSYNPHAACSGRTSDDEPIAVPINTWS
jgi:hypothetical protein